MAQIEARCAFAGLAVELDARPGTSARAERNDGVHPGTEGAVQSVGRADGDQHDRQGGVTLALCG